MPINAVNLTGNVYPAGPKGDTGPANTLEIGTVEKGEKASASITGEAPNQTLNLILPKGDKGEKGDTGETNSLSIGTVEKGTVPSATITGQAPNQILNLVLPKGDTGEKGEVGPRGEQGIQGNPGPINSIKIGRVEKGEEASVSIVGESPNQILNFVLPIGPKGNTGEKGDQGPKGEQGIQGETGATTSLSIGRVSSGEEASATIIGEAPDQILNLVLPKGDKGKKGNVGPQGEQGIQGKPGPANSLTIGTVEKGAVPSATITGEAPNQVLNLVLPTGETAEIEAIKQEQTTQRENIEKNAEGIAQNKKDVDEELTKIKKENSLLKSQIPTGTASGNNIHLEDSSNMDFEWKLRCESRQETRSGKNKLNFKNIDSTLAQSVTYSIKEGIITLDGTASGLLNIYSETFEVTETGQYTLSKNTGGIFDIGTGTSTPSILIQQKQTDGSFSTVQGTELSAKSTSNSITFKLEKGTYRLRIFTAAGNSLNNFSWKPQLENGIEATSYEQYGVSPSLEFSSEVENLEGKNKYYIPNTGKVKSYGITATYTKNTSEVILDGVATRDFSDGFEIKNILLKKGTYSVSVWGLNKINEEYDRFFVADTSNNNKVIVNYVQSYRTQKFTLEQDTNIKLSFIIKAGSTYSNTKVKIMINEGDIGLSYVPYNSLKIRKIGKNILSDNREDYNGSAYGYIKLLNNFENNNLVLSIEDNDKSIDMTGIFFGVTGNGKNWDNLGIWLLNDGKKVGNSISTNKYPFFSFYPNNQTTFDKIFKRYKIQAEISKGIVPTEFEKYKSNSWIFPLEPGQKLYEGSYLAEDGIHNRRKQIVLTGNGNWYMITNISTTKTQAFCLNNIVNNISVNHVTFKSNYFVHKKWIDAIYVHLDEPYMSQTDTTNIYLNIYKSLLPSVDATGFKSWLKSLYDAGKPVKIEYPLAKEEIIPYTQEQQKVIDTALHTYKNITNISVDNELATLDITYKKDIETMFNNQAKEYNERLSNIENLLNTTETSALLLDNLENDLKEEV